MSDRLIEVNTPDSTLSTSPPARDTKQSLSVDETRAHTGAADLRSIMEAMPAAVIIADDVDCRQLRANAAGEELLQALAQTVAGDEHDFLPSELLHLQRAAAGDEIRNWEIQVKMGEQIRYFLGNTLPQRSERGATCGAVAALVDITDRIRAEHALKEADRRKDKLLSIVAHELRNPITPIKTALDIIQHSLNDLGRREWALQVIDRQLLQLTRIVDDLLELSRIVNGKIALKREMTSLRTVVSQAIETVRPLISANRHGLRVDLPLTEVRLYVDPVRLGRAIANLLANAAKFTAPGGTLAVVGLFKEDTVEIRVEDNGQGIDQEVLPRVFDLFAHSGSEMADNQGGLGIGLAIVRRIVDLHGGTISAHSDGRDRGSKFFIRLPVATAEPTQQKNQPDRAWHAPLEARRVLIVDDNRDLTDSMAELLRLSGHEVGRHYEGDGVIEKALAFKANVLLIDLGLPGKTGFEIARLVRQHPDLKKVPLIAISGYGQPEDIERSRNAGFDSHLLKPVDAQLLIQLIGATTPVVGAR
ncbi:MAG: response regulator [Gammaproteobacteria bacterium]|nr:response regulator [Gammaproteobacteria bacterium]